MPVPSRSKRRGARKRAGTPAAFLARLPRARAAELSRVRTLVRKHLPPGYREVVRGNMIAYEVPLEKYSETYNGQPLWYAALGAPKSYLTLHLLPVYGSATLARQLADGFRAEGKKLNIGKACIRFQRADDLAFDALAAVVASMPLDRWVEIARSARRR